MSKEVITIDERMRRIDEGIQDVKNLLRQLLEANSADLVKIPEAEKRLSISRATILRRIREGVYTAYRDGRNTRVSLSQMQQRMMEEGQ